MSRANVFNFPGYRNYVNNYENSNTNKKEIDSEIVNTGTVKARVNEINNETNNSNIIELLKKENNNIRSNIIKLQDEISKYKQNSINKYKKEILSYIFGIIEINSSLPNNNGKSSEDEIRSIFGLSSSFYIDLNNITKTSEDIFNILYNPNIVVKGGNKRLKSITKKRKSKSNTKSKK